MADTYNKLRMAQRHVLKALIEHNGYIRAQFNASNKCQGAHTVAPNLPDETLQPALVQSLLTDGWVVIEEETTAPGQLPPLGKKLVLSPKGQLV